MSIQILDTLIVVLKEAGLTGLGYRFLGNIRR